MADTVGAAVRKLRLAADLTQQALAARAFVSQPQIAHLEKDRRPLTSTIAEALDRALGTTPLLAVVAANGEDDMQRRSILNLVGAAAGIGAAGGLAEVVRAGLLEAAGVSNDWRADADDFRHRLTVDSSPRFGQQLLAKLLLARQQMVDTGASPMLMAAVADLGLLYGLYLGNTGDLPSANTWYRNAATLANKSGDRVLASYVVGRAASRRCYEGRSIRDTLNDAQLALDLADGRACAGALEAHAAQLHVHALTGDAVAGRAVANLMLGVAERLDDSEPAIARTLAVAGFAESRYGTLESTRKAVAAAQPWLRSRPLWAGELDVYLARARIADGDVEGGAELALQTVKGMRDGVRVVGVAVRDAVCAAAGQRGSAVLDELRRYADPSPGPWEMVK